METDAPDPAYPPIPAIPPRTGGVGAGDDGVAAELQRQPHLLLQLAENSLLVAESIRGNYLHHTARFLRVLRRTMRDADETGREPVLVRHAVPPTTWSDLKGEVVTFIDGGVGGATIGSRQPILLRVGSYRVRTGARELVEREQFGYYPVVLGDLEGGSKEREDFPEIVRITAELLGGVAALERTPDLAALLFHGPLVPLIGAYAGHTPWTEGDIDLLLNNYLPDPAVGAALKEEFLESARVDVYPGLTDRAHEWAAKRVFEPLSWIAYLLGRLIRRAEDGPGAPVIAGVVERGRSRDFAEHVLLKRVYRGMRRNRQPDFLNDLYDRTDLTSPRAFLDRLGYTDPQLLSLLLRPGEYTEGWGMDKYYGLGRKDVALPGEAGTTSADYRSLLAGPGALPRVRGTYVRVSERTEPVRVETFDALGERQAVEAARRVWLYAGLLPGYGFPVGLDIADKYARVPAWMTDAYGKLIRHRLGVSLQRGEITDRELRELLVQTIYFTRRDYLFRPSGGGGSR